MESMSRAPFLLPNVRQGYKYGDQTMVDALVRDGLWCAFENWPMGNAAEHIASQVRHQPGRAGPLQRAKPSPRRQGLGIRCIRQ